MREEWWERPVCFICNYWWALLLAIVLALAAYFTRGYWLSTFASSPTPVPLPSVLPTSAVIATETPGTPAPTETPVLYGYTNLISGYAFNYPATWVGTETLGDVVFALPSGASVMVHAEPAVPGENLEAFVAEVNEFPPHNILMEYHTTLNGESAKCRQLAQLGQTRLFSISCLSLHNERRFFIIIMEMDTLSADQLEKSKVEFDALLESFFFTSE